MSSREGGMFSSVSDFGPIAALCSKARAPGIEDYVLRHNRRRAGAESFLVVARGYVGKKASATMAVARGDFRVRPFPTHHLRHCHRDPRPGYFSTGSVDSFSRGLYLAPVCASDHGG